MLPPQESPLCLSLLTKKFLDSVGEPMWEIRHRRIGHGVRAGDGDARALRESERRDEVIGRRVAGDRERVGWAGLALKLAARNLPWSPLSTTPATDLATVCSLHSSRRRCNWDVRRVGEVRGHRVSFATLKGIIRSLAL